MLTLSKSEVFLGVADSVAKVVSVKAESWRFAPTDTAAIALFLLRLLVEALCDDFSFLEGPRWVEPIL